MALRSDAQARCALPYREGVGLLARTEPWSFTEMLRACEHEAPDYIVSCHAFRDLTGTSIATHVWDARDGSVCGKTRTPLRSVESDMTMRAAAERLMGVFVEHGRVQRRDGAALLSAPLELGDEYLWSLSDLLDQVLIERGAIPATEQRAEDRCDRLLSLTRRFPAELVPRLMAIAAVVSARRVGDPASDWFKREALELLDATTVGERELGEQLPELRRKLMLI